MEKRVSGTPDFYDTKATVKAAADIVDLIERFIPLRRKGPAFVGHCPWHDDKSPSFQVDQRRQSWVCWVCNIRGDVFDFIMRREGIEFYDALKMLADIYNIPIKTSNRPRPAKGSAQDKQTLYEACLWAEKHFQNTLLNSDAAQKAREYLADRGIDQEVVEEFKLGFAPPQYNWMVDLARNSNFSHEVLEACDLLIKNENSHSYYERFRGRLIFPIRDTLNRPIAFGGRLVPGVFEPEKEPNGKYVNSRETRLFSKSDTLYGLNLCKAQLNRTRELTVVEGYTDVIAAWQAGLRNVVACLGTALNSRHIKLIKRYADRINLVLDGDTAGLTRANQILDLFVAENVDLRILSLPENADPFDYLRENGKAQFETAVARAPDALQHKLQSETAGIDLFRDTHAANVALENMLSTLAKIPNSLTSTPAAIKLKRDQLLSRIAKMFGIELSEIRERLKEVRRRQRPQPRFNEPEPNPQSAPIDLDKLENREVELLQLLLIDNSVLDEVIENISPEQFVQSPLKELYEEIGECFHNGVDIAFESLMLRIDRMDLKNLTAMLNDAASEKQTETGFELRDQLECLMKAFESLQIKDGNRSAISELQQNQLDEQEEARKLEQLLQLARQRKGL
jgi:DNA primase